MSQQKYFVSKLKRNSQDIGNEEIMIRHISQRILEKKDSLTKLIKQNGNKKVSLKVKQDKSFKSNNSKEVNQFSQQSTTQTLSKEQQIKLKQMINPQMIKLFLSRKTPKNNQKALIVNSDQKTKTPRKMNVMKKPMTENNKKNLDSNDSFELMNKDESFIILQDQEFLIPMQKRDMEYKLYNYIDNFQKSNLSRQIRGILIDWMQQVCMEYNFKRETFYLSCYYVDAFINNQQIQKNKLQLLGAAAMQIATKMEEIIPPSIKKFIKATDNTITIQQMNEMEMQIIQNLKYKMNPVTINTWAGFYLVQWDLFMEQQTFLNQSLFFKQSNEKSYKLYRQIYGLIDFSILDLHSYSFESKNLIASMMYLVLGTNFKIFKIKQILKNISPYNNFNNFFQDFLFKIFKLNYDDIIMEIEYCSYYFQYEFNYEKPYSTINNYEDFLTMQTYNDINQNIINMF